MKLKAQPLLFESMYELWLKKPVWPLKPGLRNKKAQRSH